MRVGRVAPPRLGAVVAVLMVVLSVAGFLPGTAPAAQGASASLVLRGRVSLASGVELRGYSTRAPNQINVVRVKAGAPVVVRPILSNNQVIGGLETTSSQCRRAAALACVNGDFTACARCTAPLGGVIRHGEVLRSPNPSWPQLSIGPTGPRAGPLRVSGEVRATYRWQEQVQEDATGVVVPGVPATEERTKVTSLRLSGVNVTRPSNGIVLYTPRWAPSTRAPSGGVEVAVAASGPAVLDRTVRLHVGRLTTGGNASIPTTGFVLSASGTAAAQLRSFWREARTSAERLESVTLNLRPSSPTKHSLGGHPVLLRAGRPLFTPSSSDRRHPRTLVGWNAAGDLWMVTIDGRQPGRSVGAALWESADILRQLGATEGISLDGGGSTTFVAKRCSGTLCVRNRPSDGRERAVTSALAVIPRR